MGTRRRGWCWLVVGVIGVLARVHVVRGAELWSDESGERRVALDGAGKWSTLAARADEDRLLFPERCTLNELFRLRLDFRVKWSEEFNTEAAYEQRMRWLSHRGASGAGAGVLPRAAEAPYRVRTWDWEIAESGERFFYRHEVDRLLAAWHPGWGEVTVGRQAIGLGRGVLFGAVDVFAPFSPLEVDREWRRGVDAVRWEYRLTDTSSAEVLAAAGESWEQSALLGRVRGYLGEVDGELVWGKRAEDVMVGGALSAVLGDAEGHVEAAVFHTPEAQADGGLFGRDHQVGKAVVGGSYTFGVGNGLTALGEYHYSGFGVEKIEEATVRLARGDFQKRYLRGDSQIVGRHAVAGQVGYPFNESLSGSLLVLVSPVDGSGVASPSLVWDVSDNMSVLTNVFLPWGAGASRGRLQSDYGATAWSFFLQVNVYY